MALCSDLSWVPQHLICWAPSVKNQLFLCSPRSWPNTRSSFQISRKRHGLVPTRTMNRTQDPGFAIKPFKLLPKLAWVGCVVIPSIHFQYLIEATSQALSTIVGLILRFRPSTNNNYRHPGLVRLKSSTTSSPNARRPLGAFATIFHNAIGR